MKAHSRQRSIHLEVIHYSDVQTVRFHSDQVFSPTLLAAVECVSVGGREALGVEACLVLRMLEVAGVVVAVTIVLLGA